LPLLYKVAAIAEKQPLLAQGGTRKRPRPPNSQAVESSGGELPQSCESEAEDSPPARPLSGAVASAACDGAAAIGRTMLSCFGECCGEDFPSDGDGLALPVATSSASGHRLAPDGTIRPVAAAAPTPLPPPQLSDLSATARSALAAAGPDLTVLDTNDGWLVMRDNRNPAVRLRWLHRTDGVLTWAQPTPPLRPLPPDVARIAACGEPARLGGGAAAELVSPDAAPLAPAHQSTAPPTPLFGVYVAAEDFFGAPADAAYPESRTGITGCPPPADGDGLARLRRTVALLAPEWTMYPPELFSAAGVLRIVFCEELRYNGQRRRDVPDLASGNLYVDVGDRAPRRKRHSLHHELWHMIDYRLRGANFAAADAEWEAANKPGFRYGSGGKHMRSDAASSQLASAPDGHFLNRYCTSAIMEDKAGREKLQRIDSSPPPRALPVQRLPPPLARARAELGARHPTDLATWWPLGTTHRPRDHDTGGGVGGAHVLRTRSLDRAAARKREAAAKARR